MNILRIILVILAIFCFTYALAYAIMIVAPLGKGRRR
jgi:hypothetical protein